MSPYQADRPACSNIRGRVGVVQREVINDEGRSDRIASVGILVVTVGVETANAQSYRRYGPARTYTPQAYPPQSRGSIPRGVPRTVPFSDPNSPEATGGGNIGYNHGLPDGGN